MRRSEGVAAQEAPAITRKAGLLSDQKGPSRTSNGTGKNAGLSSQMRVHFPTMEIRVDRPLADDYAQGPTPGDTCTDSVRKSRPPSPSGPSSLVENAIE